MATIRIATPDDGAQVAEIYAPSVAVAVTSFELEPPAPAEMARRIATTLSARPWLVCERQAEQGDAHARRLAGYAYAALHRERQGYQWSTDVSVYVHEDARRAGVGFGLYTSLLAVLALQGFYNAYGGITLPNPASVGLHEAIGFVPVGIYRSVGYKFGRWHDVGWWHYQLRTPAAAPEAPRSFPAIAATAECAAAIASGCQRLRL